MSDLETPIDLLSAGSTDSNDDRAVWIHVKEGSVVLGIPLSQISQESRDEVLRIWRLGRERAGTLREFSWGWALEAVIANVNNPHRVDLVLTLWSHWYELDERRVRGRHVPTEEFEEVTLMSFDREIAIDPESYCSEYEVDRNHQLALRPDIEKLQSHIAEISSDFRRVVPAAGKRALSISFDTRIGHLDWDDDPKIWVGVRDELLYWVPEFKLYRSRKRVDLVENGQQLSSWVWLKRIWPGQEQI